MRTANKGQTKAASNGKVKDAVASTQPDATWDVDRLAAYAKWEMAEVVSLGKRTATHLYRAGHALSLVRSRLKRERTWTQWQ